MTKTITFLTILVDILLDCWSTYLKVLKRAYNKNDMQAFLKQLWWGVVVGVFLLLLPDRILLIGRLLKKLI